VGRRGRPGDHLRGRCSAAVSETQVDDIDYYCVLARWKLGIVLEQTYQRSGPDGKNAAFGPIVVSLIRGAAELTESSGYQG
jgi:hypothetical protein